MSINEMKYLSRVKWRMEYMNPLYILDFNETYGLWFRDRIDKEFVSRTRSPSGDYYSVFWAYDPYAPKLCSDVYETLDNTKLLCDCKNL